jgi:hypothetical protein
MELPRNRTFVVVLLMLVGVAGCKSIKSAPGLLEHQTDSSNLTSSELRSIIDDLVLQYSNRLELAADKIMEQNRDPEIRRHALMWKINGIAACFQAATRRDPVASFLDIWILNKQSLTLFQSDAEERWFGDSQPIAVENAMRMEAALRAIHERLGKDFPIDEGFAAQFASDYPIDSLYFDRASIAEHYTEYIEKIKTQNRDLRQVAGSVDDQLDQLQKLSAMYAEFLPKQARWQAELLVVETLDDRMFQSLVADANLAAESAASIAGTIGSLPSLVAEESQMLRQAVSQERIATLDAAKQMQVDTLEKLEQERTSVLQAVQQEREIVLQTLRQERIAATNDLLNFGSTIVKQIDTSADGKIEMVANESREIADHVVLRIAELGGALGLAFLLLLGMHRGINRRKKHSSETEPTQVMSFPHFEAHNKGSSTALAVEDSKRHVA